MTGLLGLAPVALLALFGSPQDKEPAQTAREVVEHTTTVVATTLLDKEMASEDKLRIVQGQVDQAVDFPTISKLVLARNYKKFTEAQREEFIGEFRRHLMFTYWKNASSVKFFEIEVKGEREEKRGDWTVKTLVLDGADGLKMDYRLRLIGKDAQNPGEWKIIDILVEGVSLVSNFRSQFQSVVSNQGADKLLELLRDKNAKAEAERTKE
jgi:phospholipid transport system substrate-binding protein